MKKEKWFLSFSYYDHYAMFKRKKVFFFHLATTINTPWSREKKLVSFSDYVQKWRKKNIFFHLFTTITTPWPREKVFFSFSYYDHNAMIKREKSFFHLATMFTKKESKVFFFHLFTTVTTTWSRQKKNFFI